VLKPDPRPIGTWLCVVAATMGVWVWLALFLGPVESPRAFPLPVDAVLAFAAVAGLFGAAGVALRKGPAPLALLFLGAGAPLANTRLMGSQDTVPAALLPFSLVRDGSLTLPGPPAGYLVPVGEGKFASKYPVATAFLALPVAFPAAVGRAQLSVKLRNVVEKLSASVLSGAMIALLFLAQRRIAGTRAALIAAALTLFGTPTLPILGQALWQHTGAAFALAAGLAALGLARGTRRSVLVGSCAGVAIACRPAVLVLVLGVLWLERRRAAALAAALPVSLLLLYQRAMFGGFLRTGYGPEATIGWRPPWPDGAIGFAGLWLSPGRGLALCFPIVLFGLWGLWRRSELRPLAVGVVAFSALIGCWWAWEGGWSSGPRMLADATPLLGLGIAVAVGELANRRGAVRGALIGAAVLSCATAMTLAYVVPRREVHALVRELRDGAWTPRSYPLSAYLFAR
jgi:hypothetical protein